MKQIKIFLFTAFAAASFGAAAQPNGGIDASNIRLTHTGDAVLLEMALEVCGDAITKCQSVAVVPILLNGDNSAVYPSLLVNGRKAAQQYERRARFGNAETPLPLKVINMERRQRGPINIPYSAEIPAAAWTDGATLRLSIVLTSCAGERHYYSMETSFETVRPNAPAPPPPPPVKPPVKQSEPISLSGSAYLHFLPDSYEIMPELGNNAREIAEIHRIFDKVKNTPGAKITGLSITGFASPEAPFARNKQLSYDRAFALSGYLQSRYGISADCCEVTGAGEDWDKFRKLVEESNIAHKREILDIIDSSDNPDVKEAKLRRLAGGGPWRTMMDNMFPKLRRVEYRVDYIIME